MSTNLNLDKDMTLTQTVSVSSEIHGGTLKCRTADLFAVAAGVVVQLGVSNPSNSNRVKFNFFNNNTNSSVFSGELGPGESASKTIPFSEELNIYRVQNQTPCGRTGTTPFLNWTAIAQMS